MTDKPYKKLIFCQQFLEGHTHGLVEVHSHILDDAGKPTNIVVYERWREGESYQSHEMRHREDVFNMIDPNTSLEEVNSWIGARIAA